MDITTLAGHQKLHNQRQATVMKKNSQSQCSGVLLDLINGLWMSSSTRAALSPKCGGCPTDDRPETLLPAAHVG